MGSMMPSYATQPLQYQPCFIPPLQHSNQGMYFNSQVQSYSVVPQQYIPMASQGFRHHFMMRQPSNVPYIMHHDYVPVANSGFSHTMGGAPSIQPQFVPNDFYTREAVYEMSTVQHAQYVPQQPRLIQPALGQRIVGASLNSQPLIAREERELAKIFLNSEDQGGIDVADSLQEEQSSELKPTGDCSRSSTDTASTVHEQAPSPLDQKLSDDAELLQADVSHSPSETTLVGSPLSSDGVQTVCNSPFGSDPSDIEEDELTAKEDDQIPTKDTSDEVPIPQSLEPCHLDNVERLEPEQPYDVTLKPPSQAEQYNSYSKSKPSLKEELCSVQNVAISSSTLVADVTQHHSSSNDRAEACTTSQSNTSSDQNQERKHQRSIRSLIDTPVFNTAHSRVLSQLTQSNNSMVRTHKGVVQRPLTTHFRQLFKQIDKKS